MLSDLERLAPGFLIASPGLKDPNFSHTIILLCSHDRDGAMGVVINRPAPMTMGEIMQQLEIDALKAPKQAVRLGGPVAIDAALLIYHAPDVLNAEEDIEIADQIWLTPRRSLIEAIAANRAPKNTVLYLGHSGWGAGQLEQELSQGSWLPLELDLELLFEVPAHKQWQYALDVGGYNLAALSGLRPN